MTPTATPVCPTLPPEATALDAAQAMARAGSDVVVVEDESSPLGRVTARDLLVRVMACGRDARSVRLVELVGAIPLGRGNERASRRRQAHAESSYGRLLHRVERC